MKVEEFAVAVVFIVILIIIAGCCCAYEAWLERKLTELRKMCTSKAFIDALATHSVYFGVQQHGEFVVKQQDVFLEVGFDSYHEPSEEERARGILRVPKIIPRENSNCSTYFTFQIMVKRREDGTLLYADFYKFPLIDTNNVKQSFQSFVKQWVAFLNETKYQNDQEKQFFQVVKNPSSLPISIKSGTTVYDAVSAKKNLPTNISISGSGKMVIHGDLNIHNVPKKDKK